MSEQSRPRRLLPMRQLTLIAVYWFGINAVWGGYEWFGQAQIELIAGEAARGLTTGVLETLGAMVAIDPTAAATQVATNTAPKSMPARST